MTQEIVFSRLLKREMTHSNVTVNIYHVWLDQWDQIPSTCVFRECNKFAPFLERKYGSYQADGS